MPKKSATVPRISEFMMKKRTDELKGQPWVYLEREMREMAEKGIKPYNQKVGDWLAYLKDLKQHFRNERKKVFRQLDTARGPPWFIQFSPHNLEILTKMKAYVYDDFSSNNFDASQAALQKLGITTKYSESILRAAIKQSGEDPGVFLWALFTLYYKQPPSQPLQKYNDNAKILMSAMMFIDLETCIKALDQLTKDKVVHPPKPAPKKKKQLPTSGVKFSEYLVKNNTEPCRKKAPKKKPPLLSYQLKVWEDEKFESLAKKSPEIFLKKRRQNIQNEKLPVLECNYKFWEPPLTARITDPKEQEYVFLLKKFKNKPTPPSPLPLENIQCHIGTVTYSGNKPQYQMHNYTSIPTGYIIENGGKISMNNEYVTQILGQVKYPRDSLYECQNSCNCIDKWSIIQKYLTKSKCLCGHRYDLHNKPDGKPIRKYFKPPTKHMPYDLDVAAIADIESKDHLIRTLLQGALEAEPKIIQHNDTPDIRSVPPEVILKSLLGDLMDSPLLIPHLPKAFLLPNIQAWVRKLIKGPIGPKLKEQLQAKSKRAWLNIDRMDFRARAHRIPYTQKTMPKYDYNHRNLIQELRKKELKKLADKAKHNQLVKSNLFWATMRHDDFPNKNFLHAYCAYMPQPEKPFYIYNPMTPLNYTKAGRTCHLIF